MIKGAELILRLAHTVEGRAGKAINELADAYRNGESLRSLIPLLEHTDCKLVSIAVWVVSEVADANRGREVFSQLVALLDHPDPAVRFGLIESVYLLVRPDERQVISKLVSLAADPNLGVRLQALYWLCRIPESLVQALRGSSIWPNARLLQTSATRDEILASVRSKDLLEQRVAVAGAVRALRRDASIFAQVLAYLDDEVVSTLPRLRMSENGNSQEAREPF